VRKGKLDGRIEAHATPNVRPEQPGVRKPEHPERIADVEGPMPREVLGHFGNDGQFERRTRAGPRVIS
jgi:hypothetical protein